MASLFKKLTTALLAVAAAMCLTMGLLFTVQQTTAFAEDENTVTLSSQDHFSYSDDGKTELSGLSEAGITAAGEKNIIIDIPSGVTKIAGGTSSAGIFGNLSTKIVGVVVSSSVEEIGDFAFYGSTNLATLDVSAASSLKIIGANAFNSGSAQVSNSLKEITIPESVTSIGNNAFANRTGLTNIKFYAVNCADFSATGNANPFYRAGRLGEGVTVDVGNSSSANSVTKIPANMFLNDIQNPHKITVVNFVKANIAEGKFGANAFSGCRALTTVNFSNSTFTEIGDGAFNGCAALNVEEGQSLAIPAGVTKIGNNAFSGCSALTSVTLNNSLVTIGEGAFNGCAALGNVTIPSNVTSIGARAFSGCKAFTEITVPAKVETIGQNAFSGCISAKTINYYAKNAKLTGALSSPFAGGANNVALNIGSAEYEVNEISSYLFYATNISSVTLTNVKITGGANVGNYIFASCKYLKNVTFNNCVLDAIDYAAFMGCTSLTSIDLSGTSAKTISEKAFNGCTSLSKVVLPNSLTKIEANAFENCSALYQITIPNGVTEIGNNAFTGCIRLIEVKTALNVDEGSSDCGDLAKYALNVYSSGDGNIKEPDSDGYVFYADGTNTYLITYVGEATEITLPANYNGNAYTVYNRAFEGNADIVSVKLASGANITEIKNQVFLDCASLASVDLTGGPSTIGDYVFQNCVALTNVKLPSTINTIGMYAFSGCNSLSKIEIPASVRTISPNAFENCSSLSSVIFADESNLNNIGGSAFSGCRNLSVIRIPSKVTVIQSSAFAGCTNLITVYLPTKLENVGTAVFPSASGLTLIAPGQAEYKNYQEGGLISYRNNLTYKIAINLVYECSEHEDAEEKHHVDYRLFYHNYSWVEQKDGTWLPNGGLPVQHGYQTSVWYQDAEYSANVLDSDWLNRQLLTDVSEITIYARGIEKPELTAADNLIYSADSLADWTALIKETPDGNIYSVAITGYETYYTREGKDVPKNREAGYYTITVTLKEDYGVWKVPYSLTVEVAPLDRDASIFLEWVQYPSGAQLGAYDSSDNMVDTTLYIYDEGDREVPYLAIQEKDGQQVAPKRTVVVKASHVSYTGNHITIVLSHDKNYFTEDEYYSVVDSYLNNSQTDAGVYETTVVIAANNNYRFNTEEISARGLRVTHIANTNRYTITKAWYIAVNKSNSPLLGASEYRDQTWTYNLGNAPSAPNLVSGHEDELITFSLYRYPDTTRTADVISGFIVENARYDRFAYYVNSSMPAGKYILTVKVAAYIQGEGENSESMAGGTYQYNLNVDYAVLNGVGLTGNLQNNQSLSLAQTYAYDGNAYFGDVSSVTVLEMAANTLHPTATGFWALRENAYMYEGFNITYDIVAAQAHNDGTFSFPASHGKYYTADEYKALNAENANVVIPRNIGVYRIYYNVCAPSYRGLIYDAANQSSRENYFFTIKVYGLVTRDNLPEVGSVVYNGTSVTPYVNDANGWFDVHYLDLDVRGASSAAIAVLGQDKYVNAGTHNVALTIKSAYSSAGLLVWGNDISTQPNANKTVYYAVTPFTITPAENEAGSLYFNSWNWGKFDTQSNANRPVWSTKYVSYDGFTFTLTSATGKVYTYGDKNNGFEKADAGTYTLKAYAAGNTVKNSQVTGYNWYECSAEIQVTILPAMIGWDTAPYILSWKYGDWNYADYNDMYALNEGTINEAYGSLKDQMSVYYCLESDVNSTEASKRYSSLSALVVDGRIPAGSYALVYELEETANYDKWVYPVYFSVLKADNYWDVTPTITGWYYGDANIDYTTFKPNCVPHVGDKSAVKISYCMLDENLAEVSGWKNSLAELELDANGNLPVGNYALRAQMAETRNYDSMEFVMNFMVSKAQNSWANIPGVVSWSEGRWKADKNAFTATDMYGSTVYITIMEYSDGEDGKVIIEKQKIDELNVNTLKSLSVGSYKLIAYVDETYDHEGLETTAYFAVLEDSVGMTGLIAATMVFAVIAIGLAVGSAVLLIRRNKKVEDEFRKLIKSELHRR